MPPAGTSSQQWWRGAKNRYQGRYRIEVGMWEICMYGVDSFCSLEERIFCLKWEAECRQIARPVCATGLWPYKQMGSRSRKAEGTRNVLVLTQHIPS